MKYLINMERPIFLHFLNREATSATREFRSENQDLMAIDVLTICHCSGFSVNISQMNEYCHRKLSLTRVLLALAASRILVTTSHVPTIGEFIISRQILYKNVRKRYPMYFEDTSNVEKFPIRQTNIFSMTHLLRRDILDINRNELTFYAKRARADDIKRFLDNLDPIQKIAFREKDQAITRGIIEIFAKESGISKPTLDSSARIFSALYIDHYSELNSTITPTGLAGVGYIEDLTYFPNYDVPVLQEVLRHLGWRELNEKTSGLREHVFATYGSSDHRIFVEIINSFLHACFAQVSQKVNSKDQKRMAIETVRKVITNLSAHIIMEVQQNETKTVDNVVDFYRAASAIICAGAIEQSKTDRAFREAWEENIPPKRITRILILTATDIEDDAITDALSNVGYHRDSSLVAGEGYAERFLNGSSKEVIHVRSSVGSLGTSGSELVSQDAIKELNPGFVISVGICFGLKDEEFNIGDILISEQVVDYERFRQGEDGNIERGDRTSAGSKLLSAARVIRHGYKNSAITAKQGQLISCLKLVDSKEKREDLKARFPDAIGGDMEASGIMAAAIRNRREWIIIKAICDWGFGKDKTNQLTAAQNASIFAVKVVEYVMEAEAARPLGGSTMSSPKWLGENGINR